MERPSRGRGPRKPRTRQIRQQELVQGATIHHKKKSRPVEPAARPSIYSHIQTVARPVSPTHGELSMPSFVKKSLQEEIDDGTAAGIMSKTPAPGMGRKLLSFAQALAASTPAKSKNRTTGDAKGTGDTMVNLAAEAKSRRNLSIDIAGKAVKDGGENEATAAVKGAEPSPASSAAFSITTRKKKKSKWERLDMAEALDSDVEEDVNQQLGVPSADVAVAVPAQKGKQQVFPSKSQLEYAKALSVSAAAFNPSHDHSHSHAHFHGHSHSRDHDHDHDNSTLAAAFDSSHSHSYSHSYPHDNLPSFFPQLSNDFQPPLSVGRQFQAGAGVVDPFNQGQQPFLPDAFHFGSPPATLNPRRYIAGTKSSIIHEEDTPEQKQKLMNVMAQLEDAFDIENWSPDTLGGTADNSPEPLAVEPQRVTYTTVGSVAKSNTVLTFSPPVRIQREGANRRLPLITAMRPPETYYGRQQLGPGFALPGSFNYQANLSHQNQQQQQLQPHQPIASQPAVNLARLEQLTLSDQEKGVLDDLDMSPAAMRSGNVQATDQVQIVDCHASDDQFGTSKMKDTATQAPGQPALGLAGINKMQTLQRLAQFDNPVQGYAKERLAEFKAEKMLQQQAAENISNGDNGQRFDFNQISRYNSMTAQYGAENQNPLIRRGSSYSEYSNQQQQQYGGGVPRAPPGYPQPLTAGPPGQKRPNIVAVSRLGWDSASSTSTIANPHLLAYANAYNSDSPWFKGDFVAYNSHRADTFRSVATEDSMIVDTAQLPDIIKYYPKGIPFQVQKLRQLTDVERQQHMMGSDEFEALQHDLREERENERWYGGIRRWMRDEGQGNDSTRERTGPPGVIGRPTTEFLKTRQTRTVAEIERMSLPEVADPLLMGLHASLKSYTDSDARGESRRLMSKFELSPAWALDTSHEGRKSYFGDDWTAPPKRLGRDPRYQPSPLSSSWRNDGQSRFTY